MPVTAALAERMGPGGLAGVTIVHVNHLLNDVLDMNQLLIGLGARLVFVPVIYGEKELPAALPYPWLCAYPEGAGFGLYRDGRRASDGPAQFEQATRAAVAAGLSLGAEIAAATGDGRLLVIEDGGYHFAIQPGPLDRAGLRVIGAIEQTMAGLRNARQHIERDRAGTYPVLSVARSKLKVRFENYFIARRVVEETAMLLYEQDEFLDMKDVVLIGYGVIGRPIAALLRKLNCRVIVLEENAQIRHTATCDGFEVLQRPEDLAFGQATLVLGATGRPAFALDQLAAFVASQAPALFLASASSKRIEFAPLVAFFEDADARAKAAERSPPLREVEEIAVRRGPFGCAYEFSHRGRRRSVVLLAEGYPVNFYRPQSQSLPSRVIDPINAEILVLAHYLCHNGRALYNRLYLLGHDHLPDLGVSEEELMDLWTRHNHISPSILNAGIWQAFSPHPNEHWLTTA